MKGYVEKEESQRINNIPNTGTLTGNFFTDHYGCWWEYVQDSDGKMAWLIGEYPNSNDIELPF